MGIGTGALVGTDEIVGRDVLDGGIVDSMGCGVGCEKDDGAIVDPHNIGAVLLPAGDGASDVLKRDWAATFCRLASAISLSTDFIFPICNGSDDLLHFV